MTTEYRADRVVILQDQGGHPALGVVEKNDGQGRQALQKG
jgi:hypothetical protein